MNSQLDLQKRVEILDEIIESRAMERSAELRMDPTIDQEKIVDVVRLEMAELRAEREALLSEFSQDVQQEVKERYVSLQQELGLEIS
jgi:uncharacterized protein YfdQ (DUF2303 family)